MLNPIEKAPARAALHSKVTELKAALSGREGEHLLANASLDDVKDLGEKILRLYETFGIESASLPGAFQADLKAAGTPQRALAPVILALTALDGLTRFGPLGGSSEQDFQRNAEPLLASAAEALSMVEQIKARVGPPAPALESIQAPFQRADYFIENLPTLNGDELSQALATVTERLCEGTRFFSPGERARLFGVVEKLGGREDLTEVQRKLIEEFLYGR